MTISFRNHKFDPLLSTPKLRSSLQTIETEDENYYILQFKGPIHIEWKSKIADSFLTIRYPQPVVKIHLQTVFAWAPLMLPLSDTIRALHQDTLLPTSE